MSTRLVVLLVWLGIPASNSTAWADGGTLRAVEVRGVWRISVFTSPTVLRVGPADVSVLVQDAHTGEVASTVEVIVRTVTTNGSSSSHSATTAEADSPLYRDARFELRHPGPTTFEVVVRAESKEERIRFGANVSPPLPRAVELWPWFAAPGVVILLFLIRETVRREGRPHAGSPSPRAPNT